jgi:hypothetical protein
MESQLYHYLNNLAHKLVEDAVQSQASSPRSQVMIVKSSQPFRDLKSESENEDLKEDDQMMIESDSETSEWEPPQKVSVYVQTVKHKEPPATIALKRLLRAKEAKIKELERALLQVQTELELLKFSTLVKSSQQVASAEIRTPRSRATPRSHEISTPVDANMTEKVFKSQKVSSAISLENTATIPISPSIHEILIPENLDKTPVKRRNESEEYENQVMRDLVSSVEGDLEEKTSPEFAGRGKVEDNSEVIPYEIKDFDDLRELSIFDFPDVQDNLYTLNPHHGISPKDSTISKKIKEEVNEILAHPAPIEASHEEEVIPFPWLQPKADKNPKSEKKKAQINKPAKDISISYFTENPDIDLIDKYHTPHHTILDKLISPQHSVKAIPKDKKITKAKTNTDRGKESLNRSVDSKTCIKERPRPLTQVDVKRPPKASSRPKTQSKPSNKSSSLPPIDSPIPIKSAFEPNPKLNPKKPDTRPNNIKPKKRPDKKPKSNSYIAENETVIDDLMNYPDINDGEVWDRVLHKMRTNPEIVTKLVSAPEHPPAVKPKIPPPIKLVPLREHISDSKSALLGQTSEEKRNIKEIKIKSNYTISSIPPPSNRTSKPNSPRSYKTEDNLNQSLRADSRSLALNPASPTREVFRPDSRLSNSKAEPGMNYLPDWSNSALDKFASCGVVGFNIEKNPVLLSPEEVDDLLRRNLRNEINHLELKLLMPRLKTTIEKLCSELLLTSSFANVTNLSEQAFGSILRQCKKFMRARKLTIDILCSIHLREEMLIQIMSLPNQETLHKEYKQLLSMSQDLLELVAQWKVSGLPYLKFIFLGHDYSNKVHEDNANILALFPSLNSNSQGYCDASLYDSDFSP